MGDVFVIICGHDTGFDTSSTKIFVNPETAHEYGEKEVIYGKYDYFVLIKRPVE